VLDGLRLEDLACLSDADLEGRLDELQRAARVIGAERARCLAELEHRGVHHRDGHLSATTWLAHRYGIRQGAAAADDLRAPAQRRADALGEICRSGWTSPSAPRSAASDRRWW
jgi:hypothetical protein